MAFKFEPPLDEFLAAVSRSNSIIELCGRVGAGKDAVNAYARRHNIDLAAVRSPGCIISSKRDYITRMPKEPDLENLSHAELVKLCEQRGIEIVKHATSDDSEHEVETPTLDGDGSFKIGVVSDAHLGSKFQQLTYLNAAYDYFEREGIVDVINAGDLVGGSDRMHPGMVHELFVHGGDEQTEYACETYPKRDGIITHIISGNHDHSHMKANGTNVVRNVAKERDDINYLGKSGAYLTFNGIRMYIHHPSGGVAYARSYRLQKQIEQFSPDNKPKVLIQGHLHVTCVLEMYRNVFGFLAGCFEAQTPYLVEKGVYPEIGFSVLEITYDDFGAVRFKKEFIPFYVPLTNDYTIRP